jgi:hypothetical protein
VSEAKKFLEQAIDSIRAQGGVEHIRASARAAREELSRMDIFRPEHMAQAAWVADVEVLLARIDEQAEVLRSLEVYSDPIRVIDNGTSNGKMWPLFPVTDQLKTRLLELGARAMGNISKIGNKRAQRGKGRGGSRAGGR